MSDDEKVIHEVDGIEEYDNQLPRWWLYTLFGSIAFAACYWFVYETGAFLDSPMNAYQSEIVRRAKASGTVSNEMLAALASDPKVVEQGRQIFTQTCTACHRNDGGGNVGPNLTDEFWIHGGQPEQIYKTVADGVTEKGMPAWKPQLGSDRVQAVTAFVMSLRNTHAPNGKGPQGSRQELSHNP